MLPTKITVFLDKEISASFEGISMTATRFSKVEDEQEWEISAHAHLNFELHYIFEGKGEICLGNNEFTIVSGQFYVCPPFIDHSQKADPNDPMKEYCIECRLDFQGNVGETENESAFFSQLTNRLLYCKYDDHDGYIKKSFRILDEFLGGKKGVLSSGESTVVKSILLNVVLNMLIFARNDNDMLGGIQDWNDINYQRGSSIRNYLEANYKNDITIKDCARIFYMSERQIDRILTRVFEETFHSLLTIIRVNMAVNLIRKTDYPMDMVATEAGFSGYRQMLRSFKRYEVENPVLIRRKRTLLDEHYNKEQVLPG